jgi:signal recognition particle GTPase
LWAEYKEKHGILTKTKAKKAPTSSDTKKHSKKKKARKHEASETKDEENEQEEENKEEEQQKEKEREEEEEDEEQKELNETVEKHVTKRRVHETKREKKTAKAEEKQKQKPKIKAILPKANAEPGISAGDTGPFLVEILLSAALRKNAFVDADRLETAFNAMDDSLSERTPEQYQVDFTLQPDGNVIGYVILQADSEKERHIAKQFRKLPRESKILTLAVPAPEDQTDARYLDAIESRAEKDTQQLISFIRSMTISPS